ncbi:hypothetical protein AMECASPLE_038687 [Ameca splendens]|uniref:Uncharacterized protein n=1 Tax=Ameca splendens TaxID=208324 RepID=A0ABV0ZI43_9TELE
METGLLQSLPLIAGLFDPHALNEPFKDEPALLEEPESLEGLIAKAIRLDSRMRERKRFRSERSAVRTQVTYQSPAVLKTSPTYTAAEAEPMHIGRARLSLEERQT